MHHAINRLTIACMHPEIVRGVWYYVVSTNRDKTYPCIRWQVGYYVVNNQQYIWSKTCSPRAAIYVVNGTKSVLPRREESAGQWNSIRMFEPTFWLLYVENLVSAIFTVVFGAFLMCARWSLLLRLFAGIGLFPRSPPWKMVVISGPWRSVQWDADIRRCTERRASDPAAFYRMWWW